MDRMNYVKSFIKEHNNGIGKKFVAFYVCGSSDTYVEDKICIEQLEQEGYLKINNCSIDNIGVSLDAVYLKEL
ncbi:MAG: hypothetical protein E7K85_04860 [Clostridium sp.]|uniref:hypothetical protein n=1 Tax=Clostridium TaxID=1485 RepID=UPI00232EF284|nr:MULTISPECIES: hypothetical protein [Clostridium]MDB2119596.1 hypothetical protein [Clostridium paraputrificum]MDU2754178.1 hypothetical protein [Clostridium sp.]MDU2899907.1 hypothetical protein [Clostridium sp.]MDU4426855.1 hypothetical protein [Clostridium sp.]MDU7459953.1 hypothetical protein [Clostridium sp.]